MLCCAVAAFVICNIVFAFRRVRDVIFGRKEEVPRPNPTVAWRLGMAQEEALPPVHRPPAARRFAPVAIALLMALTVGVVIATPAAASGKGEDILTRAQSSICGALHLTHS